MKTFKNFHSFVTSAGFQKLRSGPVALIFAEDDTVVAETIAHHDGMGFAAIVLFGAVETPELEAKTEMVHVTSDVATRKQVVAQINHAIRAFEGRWLFYCYNAEFLFFPYSASRSVRDLVDFMVEERRDAVFTYALDLYADDLGVAPDGVDLENASFDRSGYYGFQRNVDGETLDRQYDIFGGLGWRYEEYVPWNRRRIDRISLFKAAPDLEIGEDLVFNIAEYNTISCPWHNNVTMAVASFRVAKALKHNPGSTFDIHSFHWKQSERFEWDAAQLLELGLIEPGQWF